MKKLYSILIRNKKFAVIFLGVVIIASFLVLIIASNSNYAAKVNGLVISHLELDKKTNSTMNFYQLNNQDVSYNAIKQDSLYQLIDRRVVESYAQNNSIIVTEDDLETLYNQRVTSAGSEEKLLSEIEHNWQLDKQAYLDTLRYDLLRKAVVENIDKPFVEWIKEQTESSDIVIKLKI